MEKFTLTSPIVMVMVGLPGSGKSYFAEQFAESFGAAIASEDQIRWALFSKHTYSKNENDIVRQIDELLISQLLRTKRTFVIDGGYNDDLMRRKLESRVNKAGFRMLTVVVQTDDATTRRRALNHEDKHAWDKYKQPLTPELFDKIKRTYREPVVDGNKVIVISGKHNYDAQARTVLKRIVMSGKAVVARRAK